MVVRGTAEGVGPEPRLSPASPWHEVTTQAATQTASSTLERHPHDAIEAVPR